MKNTQILHTHSEDVSSDSPAHAKVEEQSSFKVCSQKDVSERRLTLSLCEAINMRCRVQKLTDGNIHQLQASHSPVGASLAAHERSSQAERLSSLPEGLNTQPDRHLTISNSSNSSACCMPSLTPQAGPSYDINASARTAEQRHHGLPSSDAQHAQRATAAAQYNQMAGRMQGQNLFPSNAMLATMFDDVDSGRHRPAESELPQVVAGHPVHHRRRLAQQDSILPAFRGYFPPVDAPVMPSEQQQQLHHFQLQQIEQLLPPELLDRPRMHQPHSQHHQHAQQPQYARQHRSHEHQEPGHSSFTSFSGHSLPSYPVDEGSLQMPSDMRQWPSPAGSSARQAPSFAAAQHHMEDLDITGSKRDYSSFTDLPSQGRQPRPAPRRALSFTQPSTASAAASAPAAAAASSAGPARRGGSTSQAASNSRLSSPSSQPVSPPDTDASLSDTDDASGSDSPGANTKRRKVVKGKRGDALVLLCCVACYFNQKP